MTTVARRVAALLLAAFAAAPLLAPAQEGAAGRSWSVWRGGGPAPELGRYEPYSAAELSLSDHRREDEPAWAELERTLDHIEGRLVADGALVRARERRWLQPVSRSAIAMPITAIAFVPPATMVAKASEWLVDERWVRRLVIGGVGSAAEGKWGSRVHYDPGYAVARPAARFAIARAAGLGPLETDPELKRDFHINFTAATADYDRPGNAVELAATEALTSFGLTGYDRAAFPLSAHDLGEFAVYGLLLQETEGDREGVAWRGAGIGPGWAAPWGGLSALDPAAPVPQGPIIAALRSLIATASAGAVTGLWSRKWPVKGDARAWIGWLDDGIRASAGGAGRWDHATPFITERGLAGAYVSGLVDTLALERRIDGKVNALERYKARDSIVWQGAPCVTVKLGLDSAVRDLTLDIPEVAARCLHLEWDGPTYGGGKPPVAISVHGEGMGWKDYDALLLATAAGEHPGLVISDTGEAATVEAWILPWDEDYRGAGRMTVAFANVAPTAVDTRPLKLKLSIGSGSVEARSSLRSSVDTALAGAECRPREVLMPKPIGKVAYGTNLLSAGGSFAAAAGAAAGAVTISADAGRLLEAAVVSSAADLDQIVPARHCAASMVSSVPGIKNMSMQARRAEAPGSGTAMGSCLDRVAALPAYIEKRAQREPMIESVQLQHDGEQYRIDASWTDPVLPRDDKGRPMSVGEDLEAKIELTRVSPTRLTGTITGVVPAERRRERSCPPPGNGQLKISFDVVSAVANAQVSITRASDFLEYLDPLLWNLMNKSQREQARADSAAARRDGVRSDGEDPGSPVGGAAGTLAEGPQCACDCAEFNSPKRSSCSGQCQNYGPMSAQCVIERERASGRSEEQIEAALKTCSTDCAVLRTETRPLCLDALFGIAAACKASGPGGATQKQIDCYLDYLVRDAEEPFKSQFRKQNADQLAAMDQNGRDLFVGAMLDGLKAEGLSCPR